MKKIIAIVFGLSLCALLPSCSLWKKEADKKTAKTIEKEVEAQEAAVEMKYIKEPVEVDAFDDFEDDDELE